MAIIGVEQIEKIEFTVQIEESFATTIDKPLHSFMPAPTMRSTRPI